MKQYKAFTIRVVVNDGALDSEHLEGIVDATQMMLDHISDYTEFDLLPSVTVTLADKEEA
jgi:hypothetical protein